MRVLVSLAEQLDDRLRNTAIELLCELGTDSSMDSQKMVTNFDLCL